MCREAKALEVSPEAIGALLEGFGVSGVQVRLVIIIITHVIDIVPSRIVKRFKGFWVMVIFFIMRNRWRICVEKTLFHHDQNNHDS